MGTVIIQAYNPTTKQDEGVHLDPDTKALLVLPQSSATSPGVVQGTDGTTAERLATRADQVTTEAKIDELASQGRSANEITLANIALTTSPVQLPNIVLRHGVPVSVQNPDGSGQTVYVGRSNGIGPALAVGQPTWQVAEGTAEDFYSQNANEWYACATAACTVAVRVEGRSS